jgi:hypothetical protein
MDKKSDDKERIVAYLSYLRDVSRKIVSNSGFEKCFLSKNLGYAIQFDELPSVVSNEKNDKKNEKDVGQFQNSVSFDVSKKLNIPKTESDDEYPIF